MASVGLRTGSRTGLILRNSFQARTLSVSVLTETRSRHFHSRQINEDAPKVLITGESSIGWCNHYGHIPMKVPNVEFSLMLGF